MIQCPYCLNFIYPQMESKGFQHPYKCKECNNFLPRDFVEKSIPRASVGLVGFTGHGKTVYLTALFYLLKIIQRKNVWGDFKWLSQDDHTLKIMHHHVPLFESSQLPPGTPENFPKPALIQFFNAPEVEDIFLSFYDTAGRVYEESAKITEMGKFVARSSVVLFIISIADCGNNWADEMERLLNTYIIAVHDRLHFNLKNQHLIVILTKADLLNHLPEKLKNFLKEGSFQWWNLANNFFMDKIKELKIASEFIKEWLEENDCGAFTKLAKRFFKSVEYSIVSSTGSAPVENRLSTRLEPEDPKRVLDPFIWIIEKVRPKSIREKIFEWMMG